MPPSEITEAQAGFGNIYDGTPTRDFPAVVGLGIINRDGSAGICSGTLIAPSAVLTAAHCLAFGPIAAIPAVFADGTTRVDYDVAAFVPHPRRHRSGCDDAGRGASPARPSIIDPETGHDGSLTVDQRRES